MINRDLALYDAAIFGATGDKDDYAHAAIQQASIRAVRPGAVLSTFHQARILRARCICATT